MGYAIVSRKFLFAARIDRPDWFEWMVKEKDYFGKIPRAVLADSYRRMFSRDVIKVSAYCLKVLPNSRDAGERYFEDAA